jgi:ABC-type branched-subunit amino acid transport system ATPase component
MIKSAFAFLSKTDRQKIFLISLIQILLGFLDLVGVFLIGVLAIISVNGIKSVEPGSRTNQFIDFLGISDFKFQTQVAIIGFIAAILLISRTVLTMYFTKKSLYFLSNRAAAVSGRLVSDLLSQDLLTIQRRSSQETLFAVTSGVNTLFLNVIGAVLALIADLFLLLILSIGLFSVDALVTLVAFMLFFIVTLALYFSVQKRVGYLGDESANLTINSNIKILEALDSYRDIYVRNRRSYYIREILNSRFALAKNSAELSFIPNISKYLIEITMVFGAVLICALAFLIKDSAQAITTLSVFLAASSRIAPAILRIQNVFISIKGSASIVDRTIAIASEFKINDFLSYENVPLKIDHDGFEPKLRLNNVSFSYPGAISQTVSNISIEILPGEVVAFVGPSGGGKSTVIDLALGILKPDKGDVTISGEPPLSAITKWPGAISYVSQDIRVINSSIKSNIAMGFPEYEQIESYVLDALKIAQLESLFAQRNFDLNEQVGESGYKLSGGQRQRIGIARALYLKPKLIVLDEATSSLDGKTESDISNAIFSLKGKVTVILIAHRLSTVMNADKIVYMEEGKILAVGKFDQIRKQIPNFDSQASLTGI